MKATICKLAVVVVIIVSLGAVSQVFANRYLWECEAWGCAWVYVPICTTYGCY